MDHSFKSPLTAISIGPGIRGIERGIERIVRLEHLAYVEIEAFIIENLVAQMERGVLAPAAIWSDAKTLPCEPFRGIVDILLAGYPCQPFSTAGKRRGAEDPRHLYPYIERAIRIIRPRICFFENVRGHVTSGLPEVIASLEGLGYRVHWGIYSAEETGAAHKRERVFILAIQNAGGIGFIRQGIIHQQSRGAKPFRASQNGSGFLGGQGNGIMAHSEGAGKRRGKGHIYKADGGPVGELPFITNGTGEKLENPAGIGCRPLGAESEGFKRGTIADHAGDELGNAESDNERNERHGPRIEQGEAGGSGTKRIISRPGQPQQAWEHPRVISRKAESAVGLSAHGYHFREDVLRALGNSVYEDTAELAFKDLIRKHGISL